MSSGEDGPTYTPNVYGDQENVTIPCPDCGQSVFLDYVRGDLTSLEAVFLDCAYLASTSDEGTQEWDAQHAAGCDYLTTNEDIRRWMALNWRRKEQSHGQ